MENLKNIESHLFRTVAFILLMSIGCIVFSTQAHAKDHKSELISTLDSIADECWSMRELHSEGALEIGLKGLKLAEEHKLPQQESRLSNYIGVLYSHYLYKNRLAIPYFRRALEISLLNNNTKQTGYAYNNLSYVYLEIGNTTLAFKYGKLALESFQKINHQIGLAYAYTSMGSIYRELEDFDMSLKNFQIASNIRARISPKARHASALTNLAITYEMANKLDSAKQIYFKALKEPEISRTSRYGSLCHNGLGNIFSKEGNYEKALKHYNIALQWDQYRQHLYGVIDNYIGLALVFAKTKNYEKGKHLLNKALSLAKKLKIDAQIIHAYNAFVEFHTLQEDYKSATQSYQTFLGVYDSILSLQQIDIVSELERNFSINQELEKTKQDLQTDKFLKNQLFFLIALLLIVMLFLIWRYNSHRKMNKLLKRMNYTKDKLFSVISHDLKSPFTGLVGFSELLNKELNNKNYEKAETYAKILQDSSNEAFEHLNTLLNWSLSQSGKINFTPEPIEFNIFIKEIEKLLSTQVNKSGVNVSYSNQIQYPISADSNILKIILSNLITNAIKYTNSGDKIDVLFRLDNQDVEISVKDNGIGMPQHTIDEILDQNTYVKSMKGVREERGTGLGLSIVMELVKIHKGHLNISSTEGKGSCFTIIIPT